MDERSEKMDEALSSFHVTTMNLMLLTCPQNPPGIEPPPSNWQKDVSLDEVFYLPSDD